MENFRQITKEDSIKLLNNLKLIFPSARILNNKTVNGLFQLKDGTRCYELFKKDVPCERCITSLTLKDHKPRVKVEYIDGKPYQVFVVYLQVDGEDSVLQFVTDVDALNLDSEDIRNLADKFLDLDEKLYKDTLTGVLNRAYYDERKDRIIDEAGIVVLDLDNLKDLNDSFGHGFGDTGIKAISQVLLNNIRTDDICIRYGGDEYILILSHITKESLTTKLEQIKKEVNAIVLPEHDKVRLSISMGAVMCNNATLQSACKRADKLMYIAKARKNSFVTEWDSNDELKEIESNANKLYVMIVDDSDINRFLLKSMLEDKYKILEASDGKQAVELIEDYRSNVSLILLDIEMPNMGGFEYLDYLKENDYLNDIPVIMISSDNNEDIILRAYELGASDYITRPYNAKIVEQRVDNITKLYLKQRKFKSEIRQQLSRNEANGKMLSVIYSYAIGYRNNESGPHVLHVEQLTEIMLNELPRLDSRYSFTEEQKKAIITASGLHDIGKIGVSETILNKPGPLNDTEFGDMKLHTLIGDEILSSLDIYKNEPLVKYTKEICRWHHERYDGSGYPDGLKGDDIPIEAQIVAIVDAYDALVSERVYKEEITSDKAIEMIKNGECGEFNPILVKCLEVSKPYIEMIYEKDYSTEGHATDFRIGNLYKR